MERRRVLSLGVLVLASFVNAAELKNRAPRETFGTAVNVDALEDSTLIDLRAIHFIGKTTWSAQDKTTLASMAKQWPKEAVIEIRGYADGAGSRAANQALSAARAGIVAEFLRGNGIPAERILFIGGGAVDPNGPTLRPEHQRVDVRVFVEPGSAIVENTVRQ
jgi:outer membrane protein OmpA-like peptidoglycan-associated protein